jgi:RNA polymerase sigma-70 factor, ECF subfamily
MECQATIVEAEPSALAVIRVKAAQMVRAGYGYGPDDRDDLQQDLWLDAFVRSRKFDKTRSGRRTFLYRVVNNRAATLMKARTAGCRDYRLCQRSVDEPVVPGGLEPLANSVSADEYEARMCRRSLPRREHWELRTDIEKVIASLPADLASIVNQLGAGSVVEAARRLGLSRSTMYRRIAEIRNVFISAGLSD